MSDTIFFTKTLNLNIKKEFNSDTYNIIETEYKRMYDNGENPFDIHKFKNILTVSNLKNPSFHPFINFKSVEILPKEPIGITFKNKGNFHRFRCDFKFISETYSLLPSDESNFKIKSSDGQLYIITKEEISNYSLDVQS